VLDWWQFNLFNEITISLSFLILLGNRHLSLEGESYHDDDPGTLEELATVLII
jgi:hypothetical protein